MKKYLATIIIFLIGFYSIQAQSTDENFVKTTTYKKGYDTQGVNAALNEDKIESVQYIDGLGRSLQNVLVRQGGNKEDIIKYLEYDSYGRQIKDYLPYASLSNDGLYSTSALSETQSFYNDKYGITLNPYSEKGFESSPLNRALEQAAPGGSWMFGTIYDSNGHSNGNTIKFINGTNTGLTEVRLYTVSLSVDYIPTLNTSGYYPINSLFKTITKDENWSASQTNLKDHTTEEFKNENGRVVLKRAYNNNQKHDTYYVYDQYGNLTFVLPPLSEATTNKPNSTELSELCYQNKYDKRNRLIEMKIPGKGWEYIIYNLLDRPVLTQDANQRGKSPDEWIFTKYDAFGRAVYKGRKAINKTRADYQDNYASDSTKYDQYERRQAVQSLGGVNVYYSNNAIPTGVDEIYTINYYDDYAFLGIESITVPTSNSYGEIISNITKGLATGSKVKILGTNNWTTTVIAYDEHNRVVWVYSKNDYLGTTDIEETNYDFNGNILGTISTHKKTGQSDIVTINEFTYDHVGRLLSQKQQINNQDIEQIVQNNYDELGQLEVKGVGGKAIATKYGNEVNLSVTGNIIEKTYNSTSWNAGLTTNGEIVSDGYVEFEPLQTDKRIMAGLAKDNTSNSYTTIDYAIYFYLSGKVYVYESGTSRGQKTTFVVGDKFRVERVGNTVYYKKNDITFFTSTIGSIGELRGDISIKGYGGKLKNFYINSDYKDLVGVTASNTDQGVEVTKTSSQGWNSGFASTEKFASNGYVKFTAPQSNKYMMVGLSSTNTNQHYNTIDYAIYLYSSKRVYVYESGSGKGQKSTYETGDTFKVERIGNTVYYKKNGTIFYTSTKSSTGELLADVSLYHTSTKIKNLRLVANGLQSIDYKYNIRGWLTQINDVNNMGNDLFAFQINYDNTEVGTRSSFTPLYNGNISETIWKTGNDAASGKTRGYAYEYDALNRITYADLGIKTTGSYNLSSGFDLRVDNYDKNGNITSLFRNSESPGNGLDDLRYTYDSGNILLKVVEMDNSSYKDGGFKDGTNTGNDYSYDANGNMITDANKGITAISYNYLNLPTVVNFGSSNKIEYFYDATGVKQKKKVTDTGNTTTTDYAGNYIYENGQLLFFNHVEGYVEPNGSSFKYVYQYKDHLGNIRLSYSDKSGNGTIEVTSNPLTTEIIEENNYYPFGLKHKGYNNVVTSTNPAQKFKYNGIELEESLGLNLYEMDERSYDPAIGRFTSIDPVIHYEFSTYNAFDNNPVFWADPSGADGAQNIIGMPGTWLNGFTPGGNGDVASSSINNNAGDYWSIDDNGNANLGKSNGSNIFVNGKKLSRFNFSKELKSIAQIMYHYYSKNFSKNFFSLANNTFSVINYKGIKKETISSFNLEKEPKNSPTDVMYALPKGEKNGSENRMVLPLNVGYAYIYNDNKYNIISQISHERTHFIQGAQISETYIEIEAYKNQFYDSSFRNVTPSFRAHMMKNVRDYLNILDQDKLNGSLSHDSFLYRNYFNKLLKTNYYKRK